MSESSKRRKRPVDAKKEEIINLYNNNNSLREVARRTGFQHSTIARALRRWGFEVRSAAQIREILYLKDIPLTDELQQYIVGGLLGDGSIIVPTSKWKKQAWYTITSIHLEYLEHIQRDFFQKADIETHISSWWADNPKWRLQGKETPKNASKILLYVLRTTCTTNFKELRTEWYPDGTKIVPIGTQLTPLTCLYWYLDDGSYKRKRERVFFSTPSFSPKENNFLVNQLKQLLNNPYIGVGHRNYIYLSTTASRKFFNVIGSSPVACFDYKFP